MSALRKREAGRKVTSAEALGHLASAIAGGQDPAEAAAALPPPKQKRRPTRRPGGQPSDCRRSARSVLAQHAEDPAYLALREQMGEPLSERQREILAAHRAAARAVDDDQAGAGPTAGGEP